MYFGLQIQAVGILNQVCTTKLSYVTQNKTFVNNVLLNMDPLVDTCGGILTGDFGKISYKKNSAYGNNERCLWIIMPEKLQDFTVIKVQLVKDGFELRYDYVTVSHFVFEDGDANLITKL